MSEESYKELIKGEQIFREGASKESTDSEHTHESEEVKKSEDKAKLSKKIEELDESIEAITASISRLVTQIQEGKRIADEQGNEKLSVLHAELEEAAQQEKMNLLGEKEKLEAERENLVAELR